MPEWEKGAVALVTFDDGSEVGMCTQGGAVDGCTGIGTARWMTARGKFWSSIKTARPLVVIDPEDREQVERLLHGYLAGAFPSMPSDAPIRTTGIDYMQAALRSLTKPPKPEEPNAIGAVVEDATGTLFVRYTWADNAPWRAVAPIDEARPYRYWDGIDAVKVLSEGIS